MPQQWVRTPSIGDIQVTTPKLADGAVTGPKLATGLTINSPVLQTPTIAPPLYINNTWRYITSAVSTGVDDLQIVNQQPATIPATGYISALASQGVILYYNRNLATGAPIDTNFGMGRLVLSTGYNNGGMYYETAPAGSSTTSTKASFSPSGDLTMLRDVVANRMIAVGTAGYSVDAGLTITNAPASKTYGILVGASLSTVGSAGIAMNCTVTSTVTSFYDAIQVQTSYGAGSWNIPASTGMHIYGQTRIGGGTATVSNAYGIVVDNQGAVAGANSSSVGIQINGQANATTNIGLYVLGGTSVASPAILLDNAGYIAARDNGGGFRPVFQMAGDNVTCFFVGIGGSLCVVNNTNTSRILTINNSGQITTTNDLTVGMNLRVNYNTIYLYSDLTRKFYANGGTISYSCQTGANHSFEQISGGFAPCAASAFNVGSSLATKKDIRPLQDPLAIVMHDALQGVTFSRIDDHKRRVGFIADYWEEVMPEIVTTGDEVDYNEYPYDLPFLVMDYGAVGAITFQALKQYVTKTDARLAALEERVGV